MFDLPIPQQPEEEPSKGERPKPTETFAPIGGERFRAEEALEYDGGGRMKGLLKGIDWAAALGAVGGAVMGYFVGSPAFMASLLASAVFLYASRR